MKISMARAAELSAAGLIWAIELYRRFVSPFLPRSCRFHPTCSSYAVHALRLHGLARGSALSLKRLAKCHPWHPGGYDPVPDPADRTQDC